MERPRGEKHLNFPWWNPGRSSVSENAVQFLHMVKSGGTKLLRDVSKFSWHLIMTQERKKLSVFPPTHAFGLGLLYLCLCVVRGHTGSSLHVFMLMNMWMWGLFFCRIKNVMITSLWFWKTEPSKDSGKQSQNIFKRTANSCSSQLLYLMSKGDNAQNRRHKWCFIKEKERLIIPFSF